MTRYISPIGAAAGLFMSAMILSGMSCGAGGFSIPLRDQPQVLSSWKSTPSALTLNIGA